MAKKKTHRRTKGILTPKVTRGRIQDVNDVLHKRAKEVGKTAYALAKDVQAAGGTMTEQAVRNFLNGGGVRTSNLGPLLSALRLKIVPVE